MTSRRVIFVDPEIWTRSPDDQENPMTDDNDLSEGFPEYHRPPRDIVPRTPTEDDQPIPTGPQPYSFTEIDEHGVTRTEGTAYIAPPVTRKDNGTDA